MTPAEIALAVVVIVLVCAIAAYGEWRGRDRVEF